jgi:hypothetical protein
MQKHGSASPRKESRKLDAKDACAPSRGPLIFGDLSCGSGAAMFTVTAHVASKAAFDGYAAGCEAGLSPAVVG